MVRKLKLVVVEQEVEQAYCDVCADVHEAAFPDFEIEVAGTKAVVDLCEERMTSYAELVRAVTGIIIGDDGQPIGESAPAVTPEPVDSAPGAHLAATGFGGQETPAKEPRKPRVTAADDPDAILCTLCGNKIRPGSKYVHAPKSHGVKASDIEWVRVADIVEDVPQPAAVVTDLTEARAAKSKRKIKDDLSTVRCPIKSCDQVIPFPEKGFHAFRKHGVKGTDMVWTWVRQPDQVHVCVECTGEFPTAVSLERHVRHYKSHPSHVHKNGGVAPVAESKKYDEQGRRIPKPSEVASRVGRPADITAAQGDLPAFDSTASPF